MQNSSKRKIFSARRVLFCILSAFILLNLLLVVYDIYNRGLHPDEFQHIHFAWNMYFYKLVIFRDFWDHHGVVFALINYALMVLTKAEASFDLYYFFRSVSLVYVAAYLYAAYRIALIFFKDKLLALASIALLTTLYHFQTKAMEIRPDMLQNAFWLGAVYLILQYMHTYSIRVFAAVGILLGLSVATNLKAIGGAGLVFLFLIFDLLLSRSYQKEKCRRLAWTGLSFASVHLSILAYFVAVGAVPEYLKNAILANFVVLEKVQDYFIKFYEESFLWNVIPTAGLFLLLSLGGIVLLFKRNLAQKKKEEMFLLFITVGCLATAPFGFWTQYYLVFAPFLTIFCILFIRAIVIRMQHKLARRVMVVLFSGVLVISLLQRPSYDQQQLLTRDLLEMQRTETNAILQQTNRYEAVGFFWNMYCGGYVFNRDVQYYAIVDPIFRNVYADLEGRDVLGYEYIRSLQDQNVRFIVSHMSASFPLTLDEYVHAGNFIKAGECLLMKKESESR